MNYANKKVKVLSKEHLKHIIEITQMEVPDLLMLSLLSKVNKGLFICFEAGFDNVKDHWSYDYITSKQPKYEQETLVMDEIIINQPTKVDFEEKVNIFWKEFLIEEGYAETHLPRLDKTISKKYAEFLLNKINHEHL